MANPFLAEVRLMSFPSPPKNWAFCNGQLLPINQNQALFSLLGTNYGGNGQVNFGLPDLRGRVPIGMGGGYTLAQQGGAQTHTLSIQELPQHTHVLRAADNPPDVSSPAPVGPGNVPVMLSAVSGAYAPPANLVAMGTGSLVANGGSQAHENMQPYLTLSFCIALQGIFPSQN